MSEGDHQSDRTGDGPENSVSAPGNDSTTEENARPLPMPDVGDLLFVGVMSILLFARPDFLFQDASIGWHLVAGQYIFQTHQIPYRDLFSYTFPDRAWVAYEWLFDLIAYILTILGGFNLLAVAISALIAFVLVKTYDLCRENGAGLGIATLAAIIGIFASAVHWLARPHVITFLAVYLYVSHLEKFYRGELAGKRLLAVLAPFMVLWVNCHPAFILGPVLTGAYLGVSLLVLIKDRTGAAAESLKSRCRWLAATLAGIGAATLFNPYFLNLYSYIVHYLKGSSILAETDEFKSPIFHGDIHAICLEALLALLVTGLAVSKKRLSGPYLVLLLMFIHLCLSAVRNIPLFALIAVPAIGLLFSDTLLKERLRPAHEALGRLGPLVAKYARALADFDAQERQCKMRILSWLFLIFVTAAALAGGSLFGNKVLSSGFNDEKVPTATLTYIKEHGLAFDHGFNYDNWGGLIRYKLGQRVFIDDRADFYGEEFYTQYGRIVQVEPGWQDLLDKLSIDWILIPKDARLVEPLSKESTWTEACRDGGSVLFVRAPKNPTDQ